MYILLPILLLVCKVGFLLTSLGIEFLHHGFVVRTHISLFSEATGSLTTILHAIPLQGLVAIDMLREVLESIGRTTIRTT